MGLQQLGEKKTRRIAEETGLDIDRVAADEDPALVEIVTTADQHWRYNRRTGALRRIEEPFHWCGCRTESEEDVRSFLRARGWVEERIDAACRVLVLPCTPNDLTDILRVADWS